MKKHASLHSHSFNSLLDGCGSVEKYAEKAKEFGMTAFAITDHGNLSSAYLQFKACQKYELKPIFGCEFYTKMETSILIQKEIITNEEIQQEEADSDQDSENN